MPWHTLDGTLESPEKSAQSLPVPRGLILHLFFLRERHAGEKCPALCHSDAQRIYPRSRPRRAALSLTYALLWRGVAPVSSQ